MQLGGKLSYALIGMICFFAFRSGFAMELAYLQYAPDQFILARACLIGKEVEIEKFLSDSTREGLYLLQNNDTCSKWGIEIDANTKIIKTFVRKGKKESVDLPPDEFIAFLRDRGLRRSAQELLALSK